MTPLIDRVSLNLSAHLVPSAALTVRHHTGETFESDPEKSVSFIVSSLKRVMGHLVTVHHLCSEELIPAMLKQFVI